jgi:hypothetical protein
VAGQTDDADVEREVFSTELGADALLSSRVLATERDALGYATVLVQTPSGIKLIRAKKIVLTIPPKVENLVGFDLDATELALFNQFRNGAYYTGVLRHTGIPAPLRAQFPVYLLRDVWPVFLVLQRKPTLEKRSKSALLRGP